MEPLRLGVIGCGVIATAAHLPDATRSPLLDVVAVADIDTHRARAAADKFNVPTVYASADELLRDSNIEAVVIAMPTGVRTPIALGALEQGKHVLLEKPVAMNVAEVEQMMCARGNRVVGCCSSRYTFLPSAQVAADYVASGALGPLRVVRVRAILAAKQAPEKAPPPWRVSKSLNGGGILVNWGCYDLDYLMYITGWHLKPKVVLAQTWPVADKLKARVDPNSDAETHYTALIRCEDGTIISFERAEFAAAATEEAWQILGTDGSLRLRMLTGADKGITLDVADGQNGVETQVLWRGDEEGGNMNQALLEDFVQAVREQRPPRTSLDRALVMQQITDAIYGSAERGTAVEISR